MILPREASFSSSVSFSEASESFQCKKQKKSEFYASFLMKALAVVFVQAVEKKKHISGDKTSKGVIQWLNIFY